MGVRGVGNNPLPGCSGPRAGGGRVSSVIRGVLAAVAAGAPLLCSAEAAGAEPASPSSTGRCEQQCSPEADRPYDIASQAGGAFFALNARHRFSALFTSDGVRLAPLGAEPATWDWSLFLREHGPPDSLHEAEEGWPLVAGDRVDLMRGRLTESFLNGPKGLQHGVEIPASAEMGLVVLDFVLEGNLRPKLSEDSRSIVFVDQRGVPTLAYRGLGAADAEGRDVAVRWVRPSRAEAPEGVLRLIVDATDHVPPVSVRGLIRPAKGPSGDDPALEDGPEAGFQPLVAPANDLCSGAEVIPGAGPFPYLSATYNLSDATTTDDPPVPSCQASLSRSVWFRFTPSSSGLYNISLCSDAPTGTTLEDTVLAVYSATGSCSGLLEAAGGCDDDSCSTGDLQSVISGLDLTAGTSYYIVAWSFGPDAPPPGSASVQLRVAQEPPPPAAPPNDRCSGAAVIPPAGPFPYLTGTVADISGATVTGDPPAPSCQPSVSRSVWYSFAPATSGSYSFSLCSDVTGTTVDDTVMAIYGSNGTCAGLTQVPGGCDDDSCSVEAQSVISGATLQAGTTYYVVIWSFGTSPPAPGSTAIQLGVNKVLSPGNDLCAAAVPLALDQPVAGSTTDAANDYELSGTACLTGLGQIATTASGGDVTYRFTAPQAGTYSFRITGFDTTKNGVLYVASDCPAGTPPATIASCLGAANRNTSLPAEEVKCLPLTAGQQVYVYADEAAASAGSGFAIEANACVDETEPNGTPATGGMQACGIEGSTMPFGDVDFFALGVPASTSRIFALVDGSASGFSTDYDLRVTTSTDTLEYDDLNNDIPFGVVSPNVAGTPLTGGSSYLRVTRKSAAQQAEPYRLYGTVQPPSASATAEVEPNNTVGAATSGPNLYFTGALGSTVDLDHFVFTAVAGEIVTIGLDLDPARDNTPFDGSLALLDSAGTTLAIVNDSGATSSTTPGTGSLTATSPASPAEAIAYRVRSSGAYYARVAWASGTPGDYLLSIGRNCRIGPPTDLAVSQTDSPDPVAPAGSVIYTATVANLGTQPASLVTLRDDLPAGSAFVSATPSQGSCAGSGPVFCQLGTIAGGGSVTVSVQITSPASPGSITNTARASSMVIDTNPANDADSELTTVGAADGDNDGVPDASDCAPADATAWSVPGAALGLLFPDPGNLALMMWTAPSSLGGTAVAYDLLRSSMGDDFSAAACVATNLSTTSASDPATPASVYYYLVRAENACGGNLGTSSDGTPHTGVACP